MSFRNKIWIFLLLRIARFSKLKGLGAYELFFNKFQEIKGIPLPRKFREVYDALQHNEFKTNSDLQTITLGIVCHPKDFTNLRLVVSHALKNCGNPIDEIIMVTTSSGVKELQNIFPNFQVKDENEFVSQSVIEIIKKDVPNKYYGWVLQQAAKYTIVLKSKNKSTLILDADTILLQRRNFVDVFGNQNLSYSIEYHIPYIEQYSRFTGEIGDRTGHSYVTHHQLMQKDILKTLIADSDESIVAWIKASDFANFSPLCEYHCYGEQAVRNFKGRMRITRWGNLSVSPERLSKILSANESNSLEANFQGWNSISVHSYL